MNNTTGAHDGIARPSAIGCLRSLLRADFIVALRNKRSLTISILVPLVILFALHRAEKQFGGGSFVLALCITIGLLSTSILGYALTVAKDRESGVFQRLRVTPAPTWVILLSRLLVQSAENMAVVVVVLVAGGILYNSTLSASQYALALLASILGGAVFLSIGQAMVGLLRSATTINAVGRLLFIALMYTGLLGPSGILGSTFQNFASWSPVGVVIAIFQSVMFPASLSSQTAWALLASLGYIAVLSAAGIYWFKWEAR